MADISRRQLLGPLLGLGRARRDGDGDGEPAPPRIPPQEWLPPYLRPPGAIDEAQLVATCERCGACRDACEYGALLPLGPAYGSADGTPALLPETEPCRMCDDLPCAAACPRGALRLVLVDQVAMGTAVIDPARCWAALGQPCDYCATSCPLVPVAVSLGGGLPVIDTDRCTGCGMCVYYCPTEPRALSIAPAHGPAPAAASEPG